MTSAYLSIFVEKKNNLFTPHPQTHHWICCLLRKLSGLFTSSRNVSSHQAPCVQWLRGIGFLKTKWVFTQGFNLTDHRNWGHIWLLADKTNQGLWGKHTHTQINMSQADEDLIKARIGRDNGILTSCSSAPLCVRDRSGQAGAAGVQRALWDVLLVDEGAALPPPPAALLRDVHPRHQEHEAQDGGQTRHHPRLQHALQRSGAPHPTRPGIGLVGLTTAFSFFCQQLNSV